MIKVEIRELYSFEISNALELVLTVFMEFEAPYYALEGIDEFHNFIKNPDQLEKLRFSGAFEQGSLLGVLAMRQKHIALLFVKKQYHRKGIAKALFLHMLEETGSDTITVNSSPYAQEAYKKLGFTATDTEQVTNGIRYIPMVYTNQCSEQPFGRNGVTLKLQIYEK